MTSERVENSRRIKRIARGHGADLVGFADTRRLRGVFTYPADLLQQFPFAVSIAVHLDRWGEYNAATEDDHAIPVLEGAARAIKKVIEKKGYSAKIILPDKEVSHNSPLYWRGEISHKAVAKTAGLGWIGKSTLLVTPGLGPRVFLATILTDMPLSTGKPMKSQCGNCRMCVVACPRKALKGASFRDHPESVDVSIDVKTCGALVNRTWKDGSMCYECMLVCPKGKTKAPKM